MKIKKFKGRIIGLVIIAFITLNTLFIYFNDASSVERKSYISKWSQAITYDLYEITDTRGVFAAEESTPIYFDDHLGAFQEFLVKEGDSVSEGDDLYTYEVVDYEQQKTQLENQIDRLEEEISAIEDYLDDVEDYEVPDPPEDDSDDSSDDSEPPSYVETEFQQEEAIAEKEMELAKKEAMLETIENQLDQLESKGQEITVTSPFSGTVTHVSESLDSPILELKSSNLLIKGEFTEQQRKSVEQEMTARIYVPDLDIELTGTLSSLHNFPEEVDVHQSSTYPYEVTIDQTNDRLLPGYHADIEIITDQVNGAVTTFEDLLITDENLYAWVMDPEGKLERRAVETGITENGLIEIKEGLDKGEWLAYKPKDEFRNGATFITPIHLRDLYVQSLFNKDNGTKKTYALLGLLSR